VLDEVRHGIVVRDVGRHCDGVTAGRSDVVSELCEGVVLASGDSHGKFRGAFGVGPDVRRARPSADLPGRVSGRKANAYHHSPQGNER
jgi:hypothetical protein